MIPDIGDLQAKPVNQDDLKADPNDTTGSRRPKNAAMALDDGGSRLQRRIIVGLLGLFSIK
jgi:hypothetical protein